MTNNMENLGKLERRVTISFPKEAVQQEVDSRIRQLAKKVRMPGFRPGKVPVKMVAQQYARQVEAEVLSDKLGEEFVALSRAQNLRLAGQPHFTAKATDSGEYPMHYAFDATFEVYPEVYISGEWSALEITRTVTTIGDSDVERALEILRKQQVRFFPREPGGQPAEDDSGAGSQEGDRVMVNFIGKIDGEVFANSEQKDFTFVIGEGQVLAEFEQAVLGLATGAQREFDLTFPDDYHDKDIIGKTARFTVTVKQVESPSLPAIDAEFAKSLGIEDGDLEKMRTGIKESLQREADRRAQKLLKNQVMDGLLRLTDLEEVPQALIEQEQQRLLAMARQNSKRWGLSSEQQAALSPEMFKEEAKRRIKLGLILAELVKQHDLQAKPEQIQAEVEEFAKSYPDPEEVVRWYYSNQSRLSEVESYVIEDNVVRFITGQAKLIEKVAGFEELANDTA